jgi:hypothetical protein
MRKLFYIDSTFEIPLRNEFGFIPDLGKSISRKLTCGSHPSVLTPAFMELPPPFLSPFCQHPECGTGCAATWQDAAGERREREKK